jgi:UDP-hydrolysing UDP-N-acetyl-D-glucosamine 2-epimerase
MIQSRKKTSVKRATGNARRKVCFVVTAQNQYARSVLLLKELKMNPKIDLSIVVGGSAILPNYGNVLDLMTADGFAPAATVAMVLEGGTPLAMAKTTGLGLIEFTSVFDRLKPDIVVVRGDRYEVLAAAIAAAYLNIPIAHIEGGDVTGTIDESVRHAITKLAHLHFPTNEASRERLMRMGEDKKSIFNVGAAEVEFVASADRSRLPDVNLIGVGDTIDPTKPFLVVLNHPVTTEYGENRANTEALLQAVHALRIQTLWFWPNADAGTDEISEAIRRFREHAHETKIRFLKYVAPQDFVTLLAHAACIVGNSSAGIKEASYFGIPTVNIGTRQSGRMRGKNARDVSTYNSVTIRDAIAGQLKVKRYPRSNVYFKKGTSKRIADILVKVKPKLQKHFVE